MKPNPHKPHTVVVVGAGPAGIYAADQLMNDGAHVVLLNRDIKPGGLAEYGIYKDKYKMKSGLRKQFQKILSRPELTYVGHVTVGKTGDVTLDALREMGFAAVLVTVGAQGTKWLGLPGEHLQGVYHAKDLVYHYNKLPPFSEKSYGIGRRVAIVGVGNVMLDIARWLVHDLEVEEVVAVARRGPNEVKFTKKEMESVAKNLDLAALDAELARVEMLLTAVGQSNTPARDFILSALPKADPSSSPSRFRFEFFAAPFEIAGDDHGRVSHLLAHETAFSLDPAGSIKLHETGQTRAINVDTVIFAIGDRVDSDFGLPTTATAFVKNPDPLFPINGISYESYDPFTQTPFPDIFMAGWAREASNGLVGVARKDGTQGAQAVAQYLATLPPATDEPAANLLAYLAKRQVEVVDKAAWQRLEQVEAARATAEGLEEFKFSRDAEMLQAITETTR